MRLYRALHEIAVAVGGVLDTAALARIVAQGAIALLGADAGDVYLWDADELALRPLFSSDAEEWNAEGLIRPGDGASGQAFERGAPIHVPDYVGWPHASSFARSRNVRAALAVPLRVADQTTGVLALRFYAPHACSPEEIEMLCLLAAHVAPALEAARLYTHAQRQIDERMHAEAALRASEERFRRQYQGIPVPTFSFCHVDDGFVLEEFNAAAEALSAGMVHDWVGRQASELFVDSPELLVEFRTCATEQRSIHREQPYQPTISGKRLDLDLNFVFVPPDTVMVHTEDVTERRRAEADLRHRTLHDDLTGLPNRVLLNDRLEQAIRASRRAQTPFALLLMEPVDELKIDRSFVSEMRNDASDRAIVRSTIDLAHNLGLRVVAEGVEDAATWQLLAELGSDEAQGYHLGRPAPAAAQVTWLHPPPADIALAA